MSLQEFLIILTAPDLVFFYWGVFGGFSVDALECYQAIKKNKGKCPAPYCKPPFIAATAFRMFDGGMLAVALSSQITGPFGAVVVGISAPFIIERVRKVPFKSEGVSE